MGEYMQFAIGERVPSPFDNTAEEGARISLGTNGHVVIAVRFRDMTAKEAFDIQSGPIETGVMRHGRSWMGFMRMGVFTVQLYFDTTKMGGDPPSRTMPAMFLGIECGDMTLRALRIADLPPDFLDTWLEAIREYELDPAGYEDEYARFCDLIDSMELPKIWDVCTRTGVIE